MFRDSNKKVFDLDACFAIQMKTDSALEKKHKWAERPLPPGSGSRSFSWPVLPTWWCFCCRRIEHAGMQRKPHPRLVFLVRLPSPRSNVCPWQWQTIAQLGRAPARIGSESLNTDSWGPVNRKCHAKVFSHVSNAQQLRRWGGTQCFWILN